MFLCALFPQPVYGKELREAIFSSYNHESLDEREEKMNNDNDSSADNHQVDRNVHADYVKPVRINLRKDPDLNEKWIQDLIENDPSILNLGDLVSRDRERIQPNAGRLDLLLQDPDTLRRYEVEIQLGSTDESHIIRTIEYYDIERKRYPQYEHCAVLIAEDITSRFLNVISLFNGTIPLIAIQMQAYRVGSHLTVVFTKVLDELKYGLVNEDEDALVAPTDRSYWEQKATPATVRLADDILKILKEFDSALDLKYNKFYIGIEKDGKPFNFVAFKPKKTFLNVEISLLRSEDTDRMVENERFDTLEYDSRSNKYRLQLKSADIRNENKKQILKNLSEQAYQKKTG